MNKKAFILIFICISTASIAQKTNDTIKKDNIHFESTEDTIWMGKKNIQVTHVDWRHTYYKHAPVDKSGKITSIWITDSGIEWYRYIKQFVMTDTGWRRLKQ